MSGADEDDLTLRSPRGEEPSEPVDEPTQVDDATRLAARGLDETRIARRGPARDAHDRIVAPGFADREPAHDEEDRSADPAIYRPRVDRPDPAVPDPAGGRARPDEADVEERPGVLTPDERRERARHDRARRARRATGIGIGAAAVAGAAVALAVALL